MCQNIFFFLRFIVLQVILGFPTNQFGHQENSSGETEIMNALKYVRPGNGFEPKCIMFDKVQTRTQFFRQYETFNIFHENIFFSSKSNVQYFSQFFRENVLISMQAIIW